MVDYVQRARDVRLLVKQDGIEKGLLKAVERLAEDNEMLRQELFAVTNLVNKMADIISEMVTASVGLKDEFNKIMDNFHPDKDMQR